MNRIEFMTRLAALLQDISIEERQEAMQFYNNYFDDAGVENEMQVISELGSPEKVAATIKADLRGHDDTTGEYSETGYSDTRFEEKEMPADRESTGYRPQGDAPKTSSTLKVVLIILIVLIGVPVVIPLGLGILATIFGLLLAIFGIFFGVVVASVIVAVVGIILFVVGLTQIVSALPVAFALMGSGLLVFVLGMVMTALTVKLCMLVVPPLFRGVVELCRKPFQRKAVGA